MACSNKTKKAEIEVQFNWIFILIVGGLILFFFVSIIQHQGRASEQKLSVQLSSEFDLIFTGQSVAAGTTNIISIPKTQIMFDCDSYIVGSAGKSLGNSIVFSPKMIEGNSLISWTLSWNVPFKVVNFIYLTVPENKYYFVGWTEDEFQQIFNSTYPMPGNMNIQIVPALQDVGTLQHQNNPRVRFIVKSGAATLVPPASFDADSLGSRLTALEIPAEKPEDLYGKIYLKFFKWGAASFEADNIDTSQKTSQKTANSFPSLGREAALGAIFTDDLELYSCNMREKAEKRFGLVKRIYQQRASYIAENLPKCINYLSSGFFDALGGPIEDPDAFFAAIASLEAANRNTDRESCPSLY